MSKIKVEYLIKNFLPMDKDYSRVYSGTDPYSKNREIACYGSIDDKKFSI